MLSCEGRGSLININKIIMIDSKYYYKDNGELNKEEVKKDFPGELFGIDFWNLGGLILFLITGGYYWLATSPDGLTVALLILGMLFSLYLAKVCKKKLLRKIKEKLGENE